MSDSTNDNNNDSIGTAMMFPTPRHDASLAELKAAYRQVKKSDAPEMLKEQFLTDLADRIRDYGTEPTEPEIMGEGELFGGAALEDVAASGFAGRLPVDGKMMKARP